MKYLLQMQKYVFLTNRTLFKMLQKCLIFPTKLHSADSLKDTPDYLQGNLRKMVMHNNRTGTEISIPVKNFFTFLLS